MMRSVMHLLPAVLSLGGLSAQPVRPSALDTVLTASAPDSLVQAMARWSPYRLVGRAVAKGRSTTRRLRPSPYTWVVEIEGSIRVPPSLVDLRGRQVTVVSRSSAYAPNRRVLILGRPLWLGTSVALQAAGSADLSVEDQDGLLARVVAADTANAHTDLRVRATRADLVAIVTVLEQGDPASPPGGGEHHPAWQSARVEVEREFRRTDGVPAAPLLANPTARSATWLRAPRLVPGQRYLVLATDSRRLARGFRTGLDTLRTLVVTGPLDVRAIGDSAVLGPLYGRPR